LLPKLGSEVGLPQSVKDAGGALYFFADEMAESITSLLNLHLSMSMHRTTEASYRTGEIVRILTIFSIFLLPLNVITGIYGMNFDHMPELRFHFGYPAALAIMVSTLLVIFWWLSRKGWLK